MSGWPALALDALVVLATVAAMEGVAWAAHRHVMHGRIGWRLHRDHHEPHAEGRGRIFERNDLYAVLAAAGACALFVAGAKIWPLRQVAIGMTIYGVLYFIVHDGLVHQRWPFRHVPRRGYLKRLHQAHLMHHATHGREGAVSFGFLYAPPVRELKRQLAERSRTAAPEPSRGPAAPPAGPPPHPP